MRLRLHHHEDGARVAYREAGTGPPLVLLHSAGLSHREFAPLCEEAADRFRLVLPDLPLHGDSEDRARHPYTLDWLAEVVAGFCRDVAGPRPLVGGHDAGARILLHAVLTGRLVPSRLVLLPNPLHRRSRRVGAERTWKLLAPAAGVPGLDRAVAATARLALRPALGERLSATANPEARDLVRHAVADLGGDRARAWGKLARRWPLGPEPQLLERYAEIACPTLLLWAGDDVLHPVEPAEEAVDLLPDAVLRVLPGTGFLMAYDDPVGMGRELAAFCL